MFDSSFPVSAKEIESKAVFCGIDYFGQLVAKSYPLRRIDQALEDGILHSLAAILTGFGHVDVSSSRFP